MIFRFKSVRHCLFLATSIISAVLIASTQAFAFKLNMSAPATYNKNEVKVNFAGGFCTNLGITDSTFMALIREATERYWNRAPNSRLKLRAGNIVSVSSLFYNGASICQPSTDCEPNPTLAVSSDILISCNTDSNNFPSTAILGTTVPNNISGRTINGALVLINDMVGNQFKDATREEKIATIAHELGHAFGLGHSGVQDSLMYYTTVPKRVTLGLDDMLGVSYLYPKEQPISCGSIKTKNDDNQNKMAIISFLAGLFTLYIARSLQRSFQRSL